MNRDETVATFLARLESELADTEAKIAELAKTRDEQFATVAVMRRSLGMEPLKAVAQRKPIKENGFDTGNPAVDPGVDDKPFLGMNVTTAVKMYLKKVREPKSPADLAEALKRGGLHSRSSDLGSVIRTTLSQGGRKVGIHSFGEGKWGLAEWRPGGATKSE